MYQQACRVGGGNGTVPVANGTLVIGNGTIVPTAGTPTAMAFTGSASMVRKGAKGITLAVFTAVLFLMM